MVPVETRVQTKVSSMINKPWYMQNFSMNEKYEITKINKSLAKQFTDQVQKRI